MEVIGVTGVPGSGKSTFCRLLRFPVVDMDKVGHNVRRRKKIQEAVVKLFGTSNRTMLAKKVFVSKKSIAALNRLLYPAMEGVLQQRIRQAKKVIVVDAAVLFEAGWDRWCTKTICVARSERTLHPSVKLQFPQKKKAMLADKVIRNDGTLDELRRQAAGVRKKFLISKKAMK